MTAMKTRLFVDSRFRIWPMYVNGNSFTVTLPAPISNVKKITIKDCVIPVKPGADWTLDYKSIVIVLQGYRPDITQCDSVMQFPSETQAVITSADSSNSVYTFYLNSDDSYLWKSRNESATYPIPRLQSLKIELMTVDPVTFALIPYPLLINSFLHTENWSFTIEFEHQS
jgi:hypothetical protein